jgi:hypothetical protein
MKTICLSIVFALITALCFGQVKTSIDSRASVVFPSKVEQTQADGNTVWFSTLNEDFTIAGMAMVLDGKDFDLDSATLAANYNEPDFIQAIVDGMLGELQGVRLVNKKKISKSNKMGYDMVLVNDAPSESFPYKDLYVQFLFAGSQVYMVGVYAMEGKNATQERDKFFNSLIIK